VYEYIRMPIMSAETMGTAIVMKQPVVMSHAHGGGTTHTFTNSLGEARDLVDIQHLRDLFQSRPEHMEVARLEELAQVL
jgi:hypothetical protein